MRHGMTAVSHFGTLLFMSADMYVLLALPVTICY